ncbi:hypothetical protein [Nocardia sp. NPDC004750]
MSGYPGAGATADRSKPEGPPYRTAIFPPKSRADRVPTGQRRSPALIEHETRRYSDLLELMKS